MNEEETRAELIDPQLKQNGWGDVADSKVSREYYFTLGRIHTGGLRGKPEKADYVLIYRNQKLAVIEAKKADSEATEGVTQAKEYADKLKTTYTYATNGRKIYEICMKTGEERYVERYPTPDELWTKVYSDQNEWRLKFSQVPFEDNGGTKSLRYYQEIAINKTMEAIAMTKNRILLTMATGTGKTFIAFQIAWKLFQTRWNLNRDGERRPRVLFLADRNILADQAFNAFSAFAEDALVRINPSDIRRVGSVPTNGNIFFTIFQTFMSGPNNSPYFGEYPTDFFDFIIVDECHRGGANDESNWRAILEYFSPAVQLGLTATPKRNDNIDTYKYFGEPVYIYSLKEGVNDGFLTPFRVKRIKTTLDDYVYTPDDKVVEGEVEVGKIYTEDDFNTKIEIMAREANRVKIMMDGINQNEKTLVFCVNQNHALAVRDLINQYKTNSDPFYCVRVTANDGARGDQYLREFQDNEKAIPTILTTSQKLSTGVDARNVRNIVLMRPINSMIEFKQIIGRGTRLFDGKEYFTIYDFVDAYKHFSDPEWDGEPIAEVCTKCGENPCVCEKNPPRVCKVCGQRPCICVKPPPEPCPICGKLPCICDKKQKIVIRLRDGKEREIQHMIATSFWGADGHPISAEEFIQNIYGTLPEYFKNESELRKIWSNPTTRHDFLSKIEAAGYGKEELKILQELVNATDSDLYDALAYISFASKPVTRVQRAENAHKFTTDRVDENQNKFIEFVLTKYVTTGVEELDLNQLPTLLKLRYSAIDDAERSLGNIEKIKSTFIDFQKYLYVS